MNKKSRKSKHSRKRRVSKSRSSKSRSSKRRSPVRKSRVLGRKIKYPHLCKKVTIDKWANPIHKNFKSSYRKVRKAQCSRKSKIFENRKYKGEHVNLLKKDIFGIKKGEPNLIGLYKAYAERAVHEYSIPKPNTSSGRQLVLGPVEYLLPYYVDKDRRKSYMVLNMLEEGAVKWSAKRNQQYLACGLQSFLHSQKNNNKYPIRLVLPDKINRVLGHKSYFGSKMAGRVTAAELCAIEQIIDKFDVLDVTPKDKSSSEPYVYVLHLKKK